MSDIKTISLGRIETEEGVTVESVTWGLYTSEQLTLESQLEEEVTNPPVFEKEFTIDFDTYPSVYAAVSYTLSNGYSSDTMAIEVNRYTNTKGMVLGVTAPRIDIHIYTEESIFGVTKNLSMKVSEPKFLNGGEPLKGLRIRIVNTNNEEVYYTEHPVLKPTDLNNIKIPLDSLKYGISYSVEVEYVFDNTTAPKGKRILPVEVEGVNFTLDKQYIVYGKDNTFNILANDLTTTNFNIKVYNVDTIIYEVNVDKMQFTIPEENIPPVSQLKISVAINDTAGQESSFGTVSLRDFYLAVSFPEDTNVEGGPDFNTEDA